VTPGHSVFDPFGPLPLEVYYFGSSGADVAIAGARGIDMNGDGDVDVKSLVAPIARYSFYGEAGPDRLSGAGSRVTGVAVTGQIVTRGGVGRDVLRGGAARDVLLPEGGADKVFGGDGDDVFVSYALDGADVLHGGPGHDVADFGSRSDALNINLNGFADDGAPGARQRGADKRRRGGGRRKRERHPDRGELQRHERPERWGRRRHVPRGRFGSRHDRRRGRC
jgi:Ca2+-binding RTX toxin-like protein